MSEWCRKCYTERESWSIAEYAGERFVWCPDCGAMRPDDTGRDYMDPEELVDPEEPPGYIEEPEQ